VWQALSIEETVLRITASKHRLALLDWI
jgi:hypothetical protein